MNKQIRINAFNMFAPSHNWSGLWTHPDDHSVGYNTLDYWIEYARIAESGLLDGIFIADVFGVYDVHAGSPEVALRTGIQIPNGDPTLLIPALTHATRHIGFGVTANLSYQHPYQFARRLSTLDHLTQGRVGWNIVTGYLESGARGMGETQTRQHDDRYDAAEDFMQALYKLLEGSWENDAVVRDRVRGIFTDPSKVHSIRHDGPYYRVDGIHLSEPSLQRTPVLYQAGASRAGRQFAARHAEAAFITGHTKDIQRGMAASIREQAVKEGRDPYDVLVLGGATVIVGETRKQAEELYQDYQRHISQQGQLALFSGWLGLDLSTYAMEDQLEFVKSNAIQSMLENITLRSGSAVHVGDLARLDWIASRSPFIVGSPGEVAEYLIDWVDETDIDGFNLNRLVAPSSLKSFVDLVVPELQSRGAFKTAYTPGTLREQLFGRGARLPGTHPASAFRHFSES